MRLVDADALDSVMLRLNTEGHAQITRSEYKRIDNVIFEFPTIDAEPVRHGKWIPCIMDSRGFADMFKCSECKRYSYYAYGVKRLDYKYCPRCGAKMGIERKEE